MTHQEEIATLLEAARAKEAQVRDLERRLVFLAERYTLTVAVLRRLFPRLLALHQNARDIPKEFTAAIEAARDLLSLLSPPGGQVSPRPPPVTLTLLPKATNEKG